nr:IclR family transcriptional regulator [Desulfobacula sp.]
MKPKGRKREPSESRYQIEALSRGLAILELFTRETPTLSLSEVVSALEMNKTTAYRFLATLEAMGYLEKESSTRCYRPSLKVLQLGFRAINLDVRQAARPYLESLSQKMRETVSLGVLSGTDVIYIDRVRNRSIVGVVLEIGSRLPAHTVTIGKVLLADYSPDKLDSFLKKPGWRNTGQRPLPTGKNFWPSCPWPVNRDTPFAMKSWRRAFWLPGRPSGITAGKPSRVSMCPDPSAPSAVSALGPRLPLQLWKQPSGYPGPWGMPRMPRSKDSLTDR